MKCPKCDRTDAEELVEEVDIGVGTLRAVVGYECPDCGIMGRCPCCGSWDYQICPSWCDAKSNT